MKRILIIACAGVMLIASGVVHGIWTDRWSEPADVADAAKRLERLPMTIGSWQGGVVEMEKDTKSTLAGVIARRYVHTSNGKIVTILLACGRAGPICTHTPDVCYAGSGFEVEKPKSFRMTSQTAAAPPEFWTARFVKERATGRTHLRIFWAWHGEESWQIAENPRLHFAGEKVLYKLYMIREMVQHDEPLEGDACVEFMHDLLPAIRESVFARK